MNKTLRNLIIFAVVAVSCGFVGIALDQQAPSANRMEGLGVLVWLVSPLLANILLRTLGGDGWQDFGLWPKLKASWHWYAVALGMVLVATLIPLGLGTLLGAVSVAGLAQQGLGTFLTLVLAALGGNAVKNIFEEFAWRGYLTPRLAALNVHPFASAIVTGFIWAAWHVPYYLYFLDRAVLQAHTPLSLPVFIGLAFFVLPFHALACSELRLLSQSTWVVWFWHTVVNAVSLTLMAPGFAVLAPNFGGIFFSPGTEGILHAFIMGLIGLGLYTYRMQHPAPKAA